MSEATAVGWVPRDDSLGVRLAMVRQRMGWNVKEAATECGITVQSWRDWEAGAHCRDQEGVARKISARTGASYLWVFAGVVENGPNGPSTVAARSAITQDYSRGSGPGLGADAQVIPLGLVHPAQPAAA